jgi:hypothetical protein
MSRSSGSGMRPSVRIAAVTLLVTTLIGVAAFVATVRTYTISMSVASAFAVWNDESLVVFMPRRSSGSSLTILQQLVDSVGRWTGMRNSSPRPAFSTDAIIVRVENGAAVTSRRAPGWTPFPRPRFIEGRLLLFGGVWNGRQIETLDQSEYVRLMNSSQPDDAGRWHSAFLLEDAVADVPVRIRGEAVTLRGSRSATGVTIDLLRDTAAPMRLIDVRFAPLAVSAREFASTFGSSPGFR